MPSSSAAFPLRMEELLHKVRLPSSKHFLKRKPTEISVGQAQRVLIALALLHRPALLIADEPTSALDVCTQKEVLQLLQEISCERETSLLYVSHDLISVFQICDRMIVMNEGGIVSDTAVRECAQHDLPTAARALLQTLPVPPAVLLQHVRRL